MMETTMGGARLRLNSLWRKQGWKNIYFWGVSRYFLGSVEQKLGTFQKSIDGNPKNDGRGKSEAEEPLVEARLEKHIFGVF